MLAEKLEQFTTDPQAQALVMAIGILMDRIHRLSPDDRSDLFELVQEIPQADNHDLSEIHAAMLEILEQKPLTLVPVPLQRPSGGDGFAQWKLYIGQKIKKLREEQHLSQQELAERTGLPQSHISRIENCQCSPSYATREKLAKGLNTDLSALDPSLPE